MTTGRRLKTVIAVLALLLMPGSRAGAQDQDSDRFRAAIDAFVARLEPSTNGVVKWAASDPYEIRHEGDTLVAVINRPRISFDMPAVNELALDRIEIRQTGQREGGKLIGLEILLPKEATLMEADGTETKMTLKEAKASAVLDAKTGRGQESAVAFAGMRIDRPKTGAWISFGPLSLTSKFAAEPDGGWSAPVDFTLTDIEFFFPQGPIGGVIERIAYGGRAAGPKLEQIEKLRDAVDALQSDDGRPREARLAAFMAMLPALPAAFATIRVDGSLEGLEVRAATGEALGSLAKVGVAMEITGLDADAAGIRLGIRHEGLGISPSLLDQVKLPRRVVVDLGVANLSTEALRSLIRAASQMYPSGTTGEHEQEQENQQATQQMLGAFAMLNPTFRIYDIAIDTDEVGVDLTGEAKGSPLAPKGYSAAADLLVRGFDAIAQLGAGVPFAAYLPVLKQLGVEDKAPDGTPRIKFHLASAPQKWITINGNDVSAWFDESAPQAGQPRLLKPADPPMQGGDVKSVQQALAAAKIPVDQDASYRSSTAVAVARFQKEKGINVNGVVDAATRQRLGVAAEAPRQDRRN